MNKCSRARNNAKFIRHSRKSPKLVDDYANDAILELNQGTKLTSSMKNAKEIDTKRSFSPRFFKNIDKILKNKIRKNHLGTPSSVETASIFYSNYKTRRESSSNMQDRLSMSPNFWVKNLKNRLSVNRNEAKSYTINTMDLIDISKATPTSPKFSPEGQEVIHLKTDSVIKELKEYRVTNGKSDSKKEGGFLKKQVLSLNLTKSINSLRIMREEGTLSRISKMLREYSKLEKSKARDFTQTLGKGRFKSRMSKRSDAVRSYSKRNSFDTNVCPMSHNKFDTSQEKESKNPSKMTETPKSGRTRRPRVFPIEINSARSPSVRKSTKIRKSKAKKNGLENSKKSDISSFHASAKSIAKSLRSSSFKKEQVQAKEFINEKILIKRKQLFSSFDNNFQARESFGGREMTKRKSFKKRMNHLAANSINKDKKWIVNSPKARRFTKGNLAEKDTAIYQGNYTITDILKNKGIGKKMTKMKKLDIPVFKDKGKSLRDLGIKKRYHVKRVSIEPTSPNFSSINQSKTHRKIKRRKDKPPQFQAKGKKFKFSTKNSIKIVTSRGHNQSKNSMNKSKNYLNSKMPRKMFLSFNGKFREDEEDKPAEVLEGDLEQSEVEEEANLNKMPKKKRRRKKIRSFDVNSSRLINLNNAGKKTKNHKGLAYQYATRANLEKNEKMKEIKTTKARKSRQKDLFCRKKELLNQKKTSTILSSRASISTFRDKIKFNNRIKSKLLKERNNYEEESLKKRKTTDERIQNILGYSVLSRKDHRKGLKRGKSKGVRVGSVGSIEIRSIDSEMEGNNNLEKANKNDSFIYKQFTQPSQTLNLDGKKILRGTTHSNIEITSDKNSNQRSNSGALKSRSRSKFISITNGDNPTSPRDFKQRQKSLLKNLTSKRYTQIKVTSPKGTKLQIQSRPELDSRAKTSNNPSTQATCDNPGGNSRQVTTGSIKMKYGSSPCPYYMKDLVVALKDGVKQPKLFRYYEHFLYNSKTQLLINKNKSILSNSHTKDLEFEAKKIYLPPLKKKGMKTLVLDLDETLIHCNADSKEISDAKIPIKVKDNSIVEVGLNFRPYVNEFLESMSKDFEIVIFTASHPCYANKVLDILDSNNEFISYRVFRDHCVCTDSGMAIKDLRIFANRKIENIILVDNALYSYALQPYNGIPIVPFYNDKKDQELKKLGMFLKEIKNVDNLRSVLKAVFKIDLYKKFASRVDILSRKFLSLYKGSV